MLLSDLSSANQLMIELVKTGCRKSLDQNPLQDNPRAPYFSAINIEMVVGRTFEKEYLRRIDIYPQGENLREGIGLTALIDGDGGIIRWEIFCHFSGSFLVNVELSTIELNLNAIRAYLIDWAKTH